MLQDDRACAVTEQDAGVGVEPVQDRRKLLRTDHQHALDGVRHDKLTSDLERVKEPRASGLQVKCGSAARAKLRLHEAGCGGRTHTPRPPCQQNQHNFATPELFPPVRGATLSSAWQLPRLPTTPRFLRREVSPRWSAERRAPPDVRSRPNKRKWSAAL